MKQKSVLLLAASWLVMRLRLALLSTQGVMADLWQNPGVILVAPRDTAIAEGAWRWDGARIHFMHLEPDDAGIAIRSFPKMSRN